MREKGQRSSEFPNRFQQEGIELVNGLISLTSSAFYLITPNMQQKGIVLDGIDQETDKSYREYYKDLDPSHPSRFKTSGETVVSLEDSMANVSLHQSIYYHEFLKPMNIEHVADMFFRYENKIIAVLTMLRDGSLPKFSPAEMNLLRKVQKFLEYAITTVYLPERISQRKTFSEKYSLTSRELDVIEWIITGEENKVIASELGLGLATVKTHLNHIYAKLEVTSRAKLLSKVFSQIDDKTDL